MKKIVFFIILTTMVFAGCRNKPNNITNGQRESGISMISVDEIAQFLSEGPSIGEAEEFLNTQKVEVINSMTEETMYRFDIVKDEGLHLKGKQEDMIRLI